MTRDEALQELRRRVGDAYGAQARFARRHKIHPRRISFALTGKYNDIPADILHAAGMFREKDKE